MIQEQQSERIDANVRIILGRISGSSRPALRTLSASLPSKTRAIAARHQGLPLRTIRLPLPPPTGQTRAGRNPTHAYTGVEAGRPGFDEPPGEARNDRVVSF